MDSLYIEKVCPICKKIVWKGDKECLNCTPKKKTKKKVKKKES